MYCGGIIKVGEKYERQTNLYDGQIYDWVSHSECQEVTGLLNMFDNDYGEGVNGEQLLSTYKNGCTINTTMMIQKLTMRVLTPTYFLITT